MKTNLLSTAKKFAQENGFDTAIVCPVKEWKDPKDRILFIAQFNDTDMVTGYPMFFIIEHDKAEFLPHDEVKKIMGLPSMPIGFVEYYND